MALKSTCFSRAKVKRQRCGEVLGPKPGLLLVARNPGKPSCYLVPSSASWPTSSCVPSLSRQAREEKPCPSFRRLYVGLRDVGSGEVNRREPTSMVSGPGGRRHCLSQEPDPRSYTFSGSVEGADGAGLRVWLEVPGSLTEEKLGRLSVMESGRSGCLRHDAGTLEDRPTVALGLAVYDRN